MPTDERNRLSSLLPTSIIYGLTRRTVEIDVAEVRNGTDRCCRWGRYAHRGGSDRAMEGEGIKGSTYRSRGSSSLSVRPLVLTLVVALLVLSSCTSVRPEGPWVQVREGSWNGVVWSMFATNDTGRHRCLALETSVDDESGLYRDMERHRGKIANCIGVPGASRLVGYVSLIGPNRPVADFAYIFGMVDPSIEVAAAHLRSRSGETVVTTVDTDNGFLVLFYRGELVVEHLELTTQDGLEVRCDPEVDLEAVANFSCQVTAQ